MDGFASSGYSGELFVKHQIVSPDGNLYEFDHLTNFAKEHNLNKGNLSRVLSGQIPHTKYWHLPNTNIYREIADPSGEIHKVTNRSEFAREHKLSIHALSGVLRGSQIQHRGWHLPDRDIDRYTLYDPDGKKYTFYNLEEFCREHNLKRDCVNQLFRGTQVQHKGWKADPNAQRAPRSFPPYRLVSPEGEIHIVDYPPSFCEEHGLSLQIVYRLIRGIQYEHKGWRIYHE